jgi:RNA polymerase sigma factor (TIGR02999 family)
MSKKSMTKKAAKSKATSKKAKESMSKKIGALDAAAQVLSGSKEPMNCKDLIETMSKKGLWTSAGGKTPDATLYSAIMRVIALKGWNRGLRRRTVGSSRRRRNQRNALAQDAPRRASLSLAWHFLASGETARYSVGMSDVTRILSQIDAGDPRAAEQLLPLVYDELRKLAAAKLAHEKPGQTLQATALVHDAYLRLVDVPHTQRWETRGHFFAAAAEAMRRILVESARRKRRLKRGGDLKRTSLEEEQIATPEVDGDLIELDMALEKLQQKDHRKAELVKLRYFAGLTQQQAAEALRISIATADRDWAYARAWLLKEMKGQG